METSLRDTVKSHLKQTNKKIKELNVVENVQLVKRSDRKKQILASKALVTMV